MKYIEYLQKSPLQLKYNEHKSLLEPEIIDTIEWVKETIPYAPKRVEQIKQYFEEQEHHIDEETRKKISQEQKEIEQLNNSQDKWIVKFKIKEEMKDKNENDRKLFLDEKYNEIQQDDKFKKTLKTFEKSNKYIFEKINIFLKQI